MPGNRSDFEALFNGHPDPSLIASFELGTVVAANQAFLRRFEWSEADIVGRALTDLGPWSGEVERALSADQAGRSGVPISIASRTGRIWAARLVALHLASVDAEPRALLVLRDAQPEETAFLRASDPPRATETTLDRAQRIGRMGSWEHDLVTNRVRWSAGMFTLSGLPPSSEPPSLQTLIAAVHEEDRAATLAVFAEARHRAGPFATAFRLSHRAVETWIDVRGETTAAPDGTLLALVGTAHDISALKGSERALRESERFAKAIFDLAPIGLQVFDREGTSMRMNEVQRRILGMPTVDHGNGVFNPRTAQFNREPGATALFERAYAGEVVRAHDLVFEVEGGVNPWDTDRRKLFYDVILYPILDEDRRVQAVVEFVLDVTGRKEAEQERLKLQAQVQETQKLESLAVLAGGIAHDFNNLLVGIMGNAGLAREEVPAGSPARESIDRIETASRRAADLARQMLAYSGRGRFVVKTLDLSTLVREIADLLRSSIPKGATLKLDFAVESTLVEVDATQLRQVVLNLITNASEALGEEGGEIRLTTRRVELGVAPTPAGTEALSPGWYALLEVADSGRGMDARTRERIFEPFFTTKFAGRGLGMAAVLGIVRGHRGAITIESEPGSGSTFRVFVPLATGAPSAVTILPPPTTAAFRGSGAVLVIDDQSVICEVARRILAPLGFEVLMAGDGPEGVELFRQHQATIRVALVDLTLPNLGGEEVIRQLHLMRPELPVVLSSGWNEQDAASRLLSSGQATFLQKPYTRADLIARIRSAIESTEPPVPRG